MMKSFPHHQLLGIKDEIENDPKVNLHVPARLTNPDKLILYIKDDFFNRYDRSLNKRIDNSEMLSINVWKAHFDRASQFMNNLIKALRNRRHDFICKNGDVYLVVFGEEYPILCIEKSKKVIVKDRYVRVQDMSQPVFFHLE